MSESESKKPPYKLLFVANEVKKVSGSSFWGSGIELIPLANVVRAGDSLSVILSTFFCMFLSLHFPPSSVGIKFFSLFFFMFTTDNYFKVLSFAISSVL